MKLPFPPTEEIEFDRIKVVLSLPPVEVTFNENVFGLNSTGEIIWQIPKRKYAYENSPYMKIIREGKNVVALNWDGLDLVISVEDGKIIEKRFSK
jgi:hypothetical protein